MSWRVAAKSTAVELAAPGCLDDGVQAIAKIARLAHLATRSPSYLFGRFHAVRAGYSAFRSLQQGRGAPPSLAVGDLYHPATGTLEIGPSGYLTSMAAPAQHVLAMKDKSFSDGIRVGPEAIEALQACARSWTLQSTDIFAAYDEFANAPELYRQAALASVVHSSDHPVVRALAGDSLLVETASRFLGFVPSRVSSWLFWSFANELSDDERRSKDQTIDFHYDVDGYNFVYVSFYLVNTTARNGAHVLIEGTHRRKRLGHLLGSARLGDAEAIAAYGRASVRIFEGPPGFGFFEDASCYHKALAPIDGERLMLQFRYQ